MSKIPLALKYFQIIQKNKLDSIFSNVAAVYKLHYNYQLQSIKCFLKFSMNDK